MTSKKRRHRVATANQQVHAVDLFAIPLSGLMMPHRTYHRSAFIKERLGIFTQSVVQMANGYVPIQMQHISPMKISPRDGCAHAYQYSSDRGQAWGLCFPWFAVTVTPTAGPIHKVPHHHETI